MRSRFLHLFFILIALFSSGGAYAQTITIVSGAGTTVGFATTICYGVSDTFTATASGATGYAFKWELNGSPVPGATASTFVSGTLISGLAVSCLLTNMAGATIAVSDTLHITVDSLPVIMPVTGLDSVCAGSSTTLADATTGGVWSSTNPMAATVSTTGLVTGIAPAAPMTPTLRIIYKVTNSCGTDSLRFRFRVNLPAGPIEGPSVLCMDSIALFTDTARTGLWASTDTTIAGFFTGFGVPLGVLQGFMPGTVTVSFNTANACGSFTETSTLQVVNCDSAASVTVTNSLSSAVRIFPNPNSGVCTISLRSIYKSVDYVVSDMLGEKITEGSISSAKAAGLSLDLRPGIYFITVYAENERYTSKIVVAQ